VLAGSSLEHLRTANELGFFWFNGTPLITQNKMAIPSGGKRVLGTRLRTRGETPQGGNWISRQDTGLPWKKSEGKGPPLSRRGTLVQRRSHQTRKSEPSGKEGMHRTPEVSPPKKRPVRRDRFSQRGKKTVSTEIGSMPVRGMGSSKKV